MNKHIKQADQKVNKALTVFSQAINEVEKAKDILYQGIKEDNDRMEFIKKQMVDLEAEMLIIQDDRQYKHEKLKANNQLLTKLKEFVAE